VPLLWGSDQVCNILDLTGLANGSRERCIFSGSYSAGIIFWAAIAMLAILVIGAARPN